VERVKRSRPEDDWTQRGERRILSKSEIPNSFLLAGSAKWMISVRIGEVSPQREAQSLPVSPVFPPTSRELQ